jgi:hypothetical protein
VKRLIYAVFPSPETAEVVKQNLQAQALNIEHEREVVTVAIHGHDVRPADLPAGGTLARRSALVGGLIVGGSVALMLGLLQAGVFETIAGPSALGGGPLGVVAISVAAALFGGVGAAIAGTAGNRMKIRELERRVAEGQTLMTLEAPKNRVKAITKTMADGGALHTGAIAL